VIDPGAGGDDKRAAWDRHVRQRERAGALIACALTFVLVPLWNVADRILEPALADAFLIARAAVIAITVGAYVVIRRTERTGVARAAMFVSAFSTGLACACFVASSGAGYVAYSVGFSLVFWGFGLVLRWPWSYTASLYAAILAVHVVLELAPRHADAGLVWGLFAYLASAALIATAISSLRRRLEYQAFDASYQLECKNRELRAAQEMLVANEKLSALGRLITQLSHEINNPVNVLQNNLGPVGEYLASLEAVLDRAAQLDDTELARRWRELDIDFVRTDMKDALAMMVTAAERIRALQDELRSFMRGDQEQPVDADFNTGVRSTVAMLRRNLPPATELVERYGELPPSRFHPGQLKQVTLNLLQNALDAVGDGGRIEVETRIDRDELLLSVADTGPGVPDAAKRHLFEPFFTTKEVGKGTGLGLATCYQIMRAHGGSIALDEAYDAGARFVVRLPLRLAQAS
jgi:signal transduction histidine kinase